MSDWAHAALQDRLDGTRLLVQLSRSAAEALLADGEIDLRGDEVSFADEHQDLTRPVFRIALKVCPDDAREDAAYPRDSTYDPELDDDN